MVGAVGMDGKFRRCVSDVLRIRRRLSEAHISVPPLLLIYSKASVLGTLKCHYRDVCSCRI
jgi:hypothetical protein